MQRSRLSLLDRVGRVGHSIARAMVSRSGNAMEAMEGRELLTGLGFESGGTVASTFAPSVSGDFDRDGDVDFATTSRTNVGMLNIFNNNGSGTFTPATPINLGFAIIGQMDAGLLAFDADNDNDLDILSQGGYLFVNNGTGSFAPQLIPGLINSLDVIVYNYDNNNLPDLAMVQAGGDVEILQNVTGGSTISFFAFATALQVPDSTRFAGSGRVDSNNRDDLLVWDSASNTLSTVLNLTTGAPLTAVGPTLSGVNGKPRAANFGTDAFVDVVWIEGTGGSAELKGVQATGSTNGGFTSEREVRDVATFGYTSLGPVGDFNLDGNLDLIVLRESINGLRDWMALWGTSSGIFDSLESRALPIVLLSETAGTMLAGNFDAGTRTDLIRYDGTNARFLKNVDGPTVTTFSVPGARVIPGETLTLSAIDIVLNNSRPVTSVDFFIDSNQNGRYDTADKILASRTPASGQDDVTAAVVFDDGLPAGQVKVFAIAADSNGISAIYEGTINAWTRVFYPEGFRNVANVNEYVPMVNDQSVPVDYRVILRYETGDRDQIFETGTIPANTRWGVATAVRNQNLVINPRSDEPYAIEVQTSLPIGAQLSRYDSFGVPGDGPGTGESFTNRTSLRWGFADVSTRTLDFIVIYNPLPTTATVTIQFWSASGVPTLPINLSVPAFRRAGAALQLETAILVANSDYSALVTSDQKIIAAHTRFAPGQNRGFTGLGQELDLEGQPITSSNFLLSNIELRTAVDNKAVLFNPGTTQTTVQLLGSYNGTSNQSSDFFTLGPKERRRVSLNTLAPGGTNFGTFRVNSAGLVMIANEAIDSQRRDSTSTNVNTFATTKWGFSDGFLNLASLGVNYFEHITLYNPQADQLTVTLDFVLQGTRRTTNVTLLPNQTRVVNLHETTALISVPALNIFSVVARAPQAFVATYLHWDLTQPGGWTTQGSPLDSISGLPAVV